METKNESDCVPDLLSRFKTLLKVGVAMSAEKDGARLLEMILTEAKKIAFADAGTLYTYTNDNQLKFEIMLNDTLAIRSGGTSGHSVVLPSLPLYDEKGKPNLDKVAACAAIRGETINIPDAYSDTEFEFSGTRAFDKKTGYHSKSFLTVPMKDHECEVIGVLQLINALDPVTGQLTVFTPSEQELVESLASLAAVALVNQQLLEKQSRLLDSLMMAPSYSI